MVTGDGEYSGADVARRKYSSSSCNLTSNDGTLISSGPTPSIGEIAP